MRPPISPPRHFDARFSRSGQARQPHLSILFLAATPCSAASAFPIALDLPQYDSGRNHATGGWQATLRLACGFCAWIPIQVVLTSQSTFYFPGHIFRTSNSFALQSSYDLRKDMNFSAKPTTPRQRRFPRPRRPPQRPFSFFAGWSWETAKLGVRANYVAQGVAYLPLLGYFSGDRRGPFLEGHYQLTHHLDLNGSAEADSNNLEHDALLPTFHSRWLLRRRFLFGTLGVSLSASFSTLHLTHLESVAAGDVLR